MPGLRASEEEVVGSPNEQQEEAMSLWDAVFGSQKKKESEPDFSNVQSGSSSTAPQETEARGAAHAASPPGSSAHEAETYEVAKGDSLWKIAQRLYGNGTQWPKIYAANRDVLHDPNHLHPGQRLRIPRA